MDQIPRPSFDADIESWKLERIEESWLDTAETLSNEWEFDPSLFEGLEIIIEQDFGAWTDGEKISLSHPDAYRVGMKKVFDSEDQRYVRELVDSEYPAPFHEIVEETGQWVGRKYSQRENDSDVLDFFIDETFGMLALNEIHPEFLDYYRQMMGHNLETVRSLNDERTLYNFINSQETEIEGLDYSRPEPPESFDEKIGELTERFGYDEDELSSDMLEDLRQYKLENDSSEWRAYLAACELVQEDGSYNLEKPADFLHASPEKRSEALNHAFEVIDSDIRERYNIPQYI